MLKLNCERVILSAGTGSRAWTLKTIVYAIALWLLCGVAGELLLGSDRLHLGQIALGPVTLGKGLRHFVRL